MRSSAEDSGARGQCPGQQGFDVGDRCRPRQRGEDPAQIGVRFELIGLGRFNQRIKIGAGLGMIRVP